MWLEAISTPPFIFFDAFSDILCILAKDIERYIKYDQLENTKGPDGKSKLLYNKDGKLRKPSQVENSAEANGISVESNSRNLKSIWEKRGDKEVADMIRAMLKSERGAKIIKDAIDNNK